MPLGLSDRNSAKVRSSLNSHPIAVNKVVLGKLETTACSTLASVTDAFVE